VQAQGRLDAVLFELTLRQTYRNTSSRVLEVLYTFPLPPTAVMLGFASELSGERQDGVIVAKHDAERQYEASLEEGDAPVMLETFAHGLHSANIGNFKPGDDIVLECRFAQLLHFEQGRLRVSIPTTIAPRATATPTKPGCKRSRRHWSVLRPIARWHRRSRSAMPWRVPPRNARRIE
jgi:Ca-activated chloride channel family protein